jgi:hypothetical protein
MEQRSRNRVFYFRKSLKLRQNAFMTRLMPPALRIGIGMTTAGLIWVGIQPIAMSQRVQPKLAPFSIAQNTPLNTEIIPGVRVGPITATTSYPDLVKIFGAERLSDIRPPDAKETEREFGTKLNLGSDWSLIVVWQDKTKTKPYEIIEMGRGWKLPADLKVGMTMAELQQKLGSFQLVGLGGPYGGVVPLTNTKLEQYFGKIIVQLAPKTGVDKKFPQQYKAVSGERLIDSTDPNWQPLEMTLKYVVMLFPKK